MGQSTKSQGITISNPEITVSLAFLCEIITCNVNLEKEIQLSSKLMTTSQQETLRGSVTAA